jgi:shikimate kinase
MEKRNIVLIGFMGAGKSTVGKLLSKKLGRKFLDTDEIIEKKMSLAISQIFEKYGEAYFRDIESQVVKEVSAVGNQIISLGGGAILRDENVKTLKEKGVLIYLKVPLSELKKRLKGAQDRPLLKVENAEAQVEKIFASRKERYEEVADFIVDGSKPVMEVVDEIRRIISAKS